MAGSKSEMALKLALADGGEGSSSIEWIEMKCEDDPQTLRPIDMCSREIR